MRKIVIRCIEFKKIIFFTLGTILLTAILLLIAFLSTGDSKKNSLISIFNISREAIQLKDKSNENVKINVYITKKDKIEELDFEEYVRGVVAAEMPTEFNIEALKAQAVAARTFAAAHMEAFGGKKYSEAKGADVCDTVQCQVFINKEDRLASWPKNNREEYWEKVTKAVKDTSGEILTFDGKLVMEPYYFAVSSGRTENCEDVFSNSEPYLKSVESTGEEIAKKYKTKVKLNNAEFVEKVNNNVKGAVLKKGNLPNQVKIIEKNNSGSVKEIKLGGVTVSGVKFRSIMGLNSTNFNLNFNSNYIEINCIGYGHGVGMSQWGANAMAKSGANYKDILKHYYKGVDIKKLNSQ